MTEGEFLGSVFDDESALDEGAAVVSSHDWEAKPPFVGTVNGIFVNTDPGDDELWEPCNEEGGVRRMTASEVEQYAIPTPLYLPPGTVEWHEELGAMCGDVVRWIVRQFLIRPHDLMLNIVKQHESPALHSVWAPAKRVSPGEVNGTDAVFIEPWTAAGYGNSSVAWLDGPSTYIIGAVHVPFGEVLQVAEGLEEALQGV